MSQHASSNRLPQPAWAFDTDTHFLEPPALWNEYIDPAYRSSVPVLRENEGRLTLVVDDRGYPTSPAHVGLASLYHADGRAVDRLAPVQRTGLDPSERLARMNDLGVGAEVVYPTIAMMGASAIRDPHLAGAHCRAYNRFAADHSSPSGGRLLAAMTAPLNHPQVAVEEIRYARQQLGLSVLYASFSAIPSSLGTRDSDAMWATMQDLDLTVTFQESSLAAAPPVPGSASARSWRLLYLSAHVIAVQVGIADLIFGGVLERFPELRIGVQETHVTWIPGWLQLLDERSADMHRLSVRPSDYFRRQCFATAFPDEPGVRAYLDAVGRENLLFASDWPHRELVPGTEPDWAREVRQRDDLVPAEVAASLHENPARWFPGRKT
jgi:predicted TIM-barrel fold metal-dependent hydrolase